jgi:hypothetical protein
MARALHSLEPREDEAMSKIWVVLGIVILAGCGDSKGKDAPFRDVTVSVTNTGTADAYGDAEDWNSDGKENFTVPAGATLTFQITISDRLRVHLYRSTDQQPLFDDYWDKDDLWKMGDLVSITVTP